MGELKEMQTKELQNGRLGMIAAAGKNTDLVAGGGGASGGQKTNAAGGSLIGSKGAPTQAGRGGGKIPEIRVAGTWNDPAHPGCTRKIAVNGSKAFISGADEDGKKWKVTGEVKGKSIIVDFTPKGGPKDIEAKYVIGKGLVFPEATSGRRRDRLGCDSRATP